MLSELIQNFWRPLLVGVLSILTIGLVVKAVRFIKWWRFFQGLPGESDFSFRYGNLHKVPINGEERIRYFQRFMDKVNNKFCRIWYGPIEPCIYIYHPDTVKQVFKSSDAPKVRSFGSAYRMVTPWLGYSVLSSNGKTWLRARRLLTPAFHYEILRHYLGVYNRCSDTLLELFGKHADKGTDFDIFPMASLFTLETLLKCAMGVNWGLQRMGSHPYVTAIEELTKLWGLRLRNPYIWPDLIYYLTQNGRTFLKNCDYVHEVAEDVIKERRRSYEVEGPPKTRHLDFLDILLSAKDENGEPMTPLEIRTEVDTFLFAGHDTTSSGMAWMFYSMAKYPHYQRLVQEEVDNILQGREDDDILWSDLPNLQMLSICLKESMRIYPPVPTIDRVLSEPLYIDGKEIPAGTEFSIPMMLLHRNADVWEDPETYYPERFLKENSHNLDPFAFTPFSAGSRNCIGQNFALQELKVMTARVLRRFDLDLDPKREDPKRVQQAILRAENGLWIKATKRQI